MGNGTKTTISRFAALHVNALKVNSIFLYFVCTLRLKSLEDIGLEDLWLKCHCTHFTDGLLVRGDVTEVVCLGPYSKIGKYIQE